MRKPPHEKGFVIPVKRRLAKGRYQKAWAKTLKPGTDGRVAVCFDSGCRSSWEKKSVIYEPLGFNPRIGKQKGVENERQDS